MPFLKLCGFVIGGWLMAKAATIAAGKLAGTDKDFYRAKLRTALFYAAAGVADSARAGARRGERREQCDRDGRIA